MAVLCRRPIVIASGLQPLPIRRCGEPSDARPNARPDAEDLPMRLAPIRNERHPSGGIQASRHTRRRAERDELLRSDGAARPEQLPARPKRFPPAPRLKRGPKEFCVSLCSSPTIFSEKRLGINHIPDSFSLLGTPPVNAWFRFGPLHKRLLINRSPCFGAPAILVVPCSWSASIRRAGRAFI